MPKRAPKYTPEQVAESVHAAATVDLTHYDIILISTSAGKDSQVMLDVVYTMAFEQGVADRVCAVHCDLGRAEWAGTAALAQRQCDRYGVPLLVVQRPQGDFLHQLEHERRMWPDDQNRWCTSDQKRTQVETAITQFVSALAGGKLRKYRGRATRVLSCLGLRAQESDSRKAELPFRANDRTTSGIRQIDRWLPIHQWTETQVWERIRTKGLEYHRAYDLGMPRLSCVFCFYAPPEALLLAGYHNRPLLAELVRIEGAIGHTIKADLSLTQIQATLEGGYVPRQAVVEWGKECAA